MQKGKKDTEEEEEKKLASSDMFMFNFEESKITIPQTAQTFYDGAYSFTFVKGKSRDNGVSLQLDHVLR